ncbi:MAG: hypothetical protein HKN23_09040 [Verrucomicrobiales bacterium]|nr:hypothetical protein [Verrucomicrobiales bacterium]
MEFPSSFLLAQTYDREWWNAIFFALFIGFALAALVWLVIWMLLGGEDSEEIETVETTAAEPEITEEEPTQAVEDNDSGEEAPPQIETASEEEAKGAFAEEIASGKARMDDTYGIVFASEPDEVDDLKVISGIAKVLEGKLHGIGVYTFKQVAFWTDGACSEFSKMLTFKDRIYRDNWIKQAKELHEEKYGEKL